MSPEEEMGRRQGPILGKKRMSLVTACERTELARLGKRAVEKYRKEHNHA